MWLKNIRGQAATQQTSAKRFSVSSAKPQHRCEPAIDVLGEVKPNPVHKSRKPPSSDVACETICPRRFTFTWRAQQPQRRHVCLHMKRCRAVCLLLLIQLAVLLAINMEPAGSDAMLIQDAISRGAESCVLLLHGRPHLLHQLITSLLRSPHNLDHDAILRIFSLVVFGFEPSQAVEYLKVLKPAGYCGHVFKEGEFSYKCASSAVSFKFKCLSSLMAAHHNSCGCRCMDCAADATCVVCTECFHGGNHEGHRYVMHAPRPRPPPPSFPLPFLPLRILN
jgi:hypothetical protein